MNIRRRSMLRDMLDQLMPFDEQIVEEEYPLESGSSLAAFLRRWEENRAFTEAFERIWRRLSSPESFPRRGEPTRSFRIFTPEEEELLSTEARGFLTTVSSSGVLTTAQLETVVDRAFECWTDEITLDQVRFLVSAVLLHETFDTDESEPDGSSPGCSGPC